MAMNIILNRSRPLLLKTLNPIFFKPISTSPFLSQQPQHLISDPPSQISSQNPSGPTQSLVPSVPFMEPQHMRFKRIALSLDLEAVKEIFATWMTLQKWDDVKLLYDIWLTCYDKNGKQNVPDLGLFNNYLRANLMLNASPVYMCQLVSSLEAYEMKLNTASRNLILEAMLKSRDIDSALKYLDGMIEIGEKDKDSKPDEESFELVIRMLLPPNGQYKEKQMEAAYKYIDLNLKSGYSMSQDAFNRCVWNFMNFGSLDTLVSIIERCKKMDQNKALVADWKLCLEMLEHAMKADNSELAFNALFFMAQWMKIGLNTRPPRYLFVEEGLVVSLLATARRTYSKKLLEAALSILKRSLCRNKVASAETYIARIHAHASQVHLMKAFDALFEFESLYGGSDKQAEEDLFSPFTALNPLVVACSHNGFTTLDSVYFQLENLSKKNPPSKSVAALNCIILGCANIWDAERASQTFEAISTTFGLTPDINSYNGLICAYGKSNQREKALELFEQLKGLGIKPNATTYALLVDAHLIAKDPISEKMAHTSNILLDLEAEKPASSSIESKLLFCVNHDSRPQPKVTKSNPPQKKPTIRPLPKSQVLDKLKDFLPVMSEANKKLQLAAMDNTKVFDIESLEDNDSAHIEMDLMLGVADLNTPEAIAAAESAINGNQPVLSFAATSESSDSSDGDNEDDNYSESTSDDEGHKEQSSCDEDDQGKDGRKLKCLPVNMKRAKSVGKESYDELRNKQSSKRPKIVEL